MFAAERTVFRLKIPAIFNVKVRKCPMYMSADFLPSFRCPKDSYNWDLRLILYLRRPDVVLEDGIVFGRRRLVVIDAIQADAEQLHLSTRINQAAVSFFLT